MTVHTPQPGQPVIELWTYFVVDPVGVPLSRRLARMRVVTPNRLTAVALALGIAAAACFATGRLRIGGALFLLRFFVDCLDGTVARIQGSCSKRGAYFDLGADVIGVTAGYAALGWYLVDSGRLDLAWLLALLGSLVPLQLGAGLPQAVGRGRRARQRRRVPPVVAVMGTAATLGDVLQQPGGLDGAVGRGVEIATLGLAPLLLPTHVLPWAIIAALAFYVFADLLNARRVWRIAGHLDRQEVTS